MSRILIIEEDEPIRLLLAEWLAAEGHRVQAATAEGEASCASRAGPVDVVIVSLAQPRGRECERLRAIRRAWPDARLIAISARFHSGVRGTGATAVAMGADRLLAKPFDRAALLDAVRPSVNAPA